MIRYGKYKVITHTYVDNLLQKTYEENRVVYSSKGKFYVNFLSGKREVQHIGNDIFLLEIRFIPVKFE